MQIPENQFNLETTATEPNTSFPLPRAAKTLFYMGAGLVTLGLMFAKVNGSVASEVRENFGNESAFWPGMGAGDTFHIDHNKNSPVYSEPEWLIFSDHISHALYHGIFHFWQIPEAISMKPDENFNAVRQQLSLFNRKEPGHELVARGQKQDHLFFPRDNDIPTDVKLRVLLLSADWLNGLNLERNTITKRRGYAQDHFVPKPKLHLNGKPYLVPDNAADRLTRVDRAVANCQQLLDPDEVDTLVENFVPYMNIFKLGIGLDERTRGTVLTAMEVGYFANDEVNLNLETAADVVTRPRQRKVINKSQIQTPPSLNDLTALQAFTRELAK